MDWKLGIATSFQMVDVRMESNPLKLFACTYTKVKKRNERRVHRVLCNATRSMTLNLYTNKTLREALTERYG